MLGNLLEDLGLFISLKFTAMTKPMHSIPPTNKEQKQTCANGAELICYALNELLPDLANQVAVQELLYAYLFDQEQQLNITQLRIILQSKTPAALDDFLSVLEGAKIASTSFSLDTPELLDEYLEQKYQAQNPFQAYKPSSPIISN